MFSNNFDILREKNNADLLVQHRTVYDGVGELDIHGMILDSACPTYIHHDGLICYTAENGNSVYRLITEIYYKKISDNFMSFNGKSHFPVGISDLLCDIREFSASVHFTSNPFYQDGPKQLIIEINESCLPTTKTC